MNKRKEKEAEDAFIRCCHHLIKMLMKYGDAAAEEAKKSQAQQAKKESQISFF